MQPVSDMVFADEELVHACCTILLEWRILLQQQCHPLRLDTLRLVRSPQNQRQLRSQLRVLRCFTFGLEVDALGSCRQWYCQALPSSGGVLALGRYIVIFGSQS